MPNSSTSLQQDATPPSNPQQAGLPTGPTGLPKQRPALAQLREAMTALHIGRLCRAVSYELFTYWSPGGNVFPSVKVMADAMGLKRRAVRHHIAHLERVGLWVRIGREDETNIYVLHLPGEAQEGFVKPSPRAPPARTCRTPGTQMPPEVISEVIKEVTNTSSSRAREVCKICGNNWPAEYGTTCFECGRSPSTGKPADDTPTDDPQACTCGDAYRQSYGRRCVDCEGTPSAAQSDAAREKGACRGTGDGPGVDGGGATDNPSVPETDARQPPETRAQRPDRSVSSEHGSPPDGGEGEDEPTPKADHDALLRWWNKEQAQYGRKQTPTTEGETA